MTLHKGYPKEICNVQVNYYHVKTAHHDKSIKCASKHRVTKVQVFTSCSSNSLRIYQSALYGPSYSSAEQDFSPYMARKEKTPVTFGALPLLPCKHNLCFCSSTYTPHIFTMSDDMGKLPLGVNYHYYKGDSVFQKEEEKCILKKWLPTAS